MTNDKSITWHLHITGLVQGVGFRPYVYLVAQEYHINGVVRNDVDGLHIKFNATKAVAEKFKRKIATDSPPPLAQITSTTLRPISYLSFSNFEITHDSQKSASNLIITPDMALCPECQKDLDDPLNIRYDYPFISCSQCGPRYSIINHLPYDRYNTEMSVFGMCNACSKEYHDSSDRRYYAQTNSCPNCAITLSLYDSNRNTISSVTKEIIDDVPQFWREGKIVAIKGIGGYLLTCDASKTESIVELRKRKHRPSKPLAIMYPNIRSLDKYTIGPKAVEMLQNHLAPIVLIPVHTKDKRKGICDGHDHIGVMLPYAPIFKILLERFDQPIIATSANISSAPIVFQHDEASLRQLTELSDYVLSNNRKITVSQDDSVVKFTPFIQQKIILRRSRGLAPTFINPNLLWSKQCKLSTGSQLKSSFSLLHKGRVHISQYLGDLDNFDVKENYNYTLDHFIKLVRAEPEVVLSDYHKEYASTIHGQEYAKAKSIPIVYIQHHKAHFSAILGEHNLIDTQEPILGVIWDGAGLGDDECIWGSELFLYEKEHFTRYGHLSYFDLILGDKMAKEPRLSALSLCHHLENSNEFLNKKFSTVEMKLYRRMLQSDSHIQTSSMGRLFDAISSILGLIDKQTFEGEAAMQLEFAALRHIRKYGLGAVDEHYPITPPNNRLSSKKLMEQVVYDLNKGLPITLIAAKFHFTLVKWIEAVARDQNCRKIAFSGGVFQNSLLVDLIVHHLGGELNLYFHEQLSPNDENISFGQLIYHQIANKRMKNG